MIENKYYCKNCHAEIKSTDTVCPKCDKNLKEVGRIVEVTVTDELNISDVVRVEKLSPEKKSLEQGLNNLAAFILIGIGIVIIVSVFTATITVIGKGKDISVTITPNIYLPNSNMGVLNENAIFVVNTSNFANFTNPITIILFAGQDIVRSEVLLTDAHGKNSTAISAQLFQLGSWRIEALDRGNMSITNYAFNVMLNRDEADFMSSQYYRSTITLNIMYWSLIVGVISIIVGIILFILGKMGILIVRRPKSRPEIV